MTSDPSPIEFPRESLYCRNKKCPLVDMRQFTNGRTACRLCDLTFEEYREVTREEKMLLEEPLSELPESVADIAPNCAYTFKKFRTEKKLSQEQVAEKMHTSRTHISKFESGGVLPTLGSCESFANAIGITMLTLIETMYDPMTDSFMDQLMKIATIRNLSKKQRCVLWKKTLKILTEHFSLTGT